MELQKITDGYRAGQEINCGITAQIKKPQDYPSTIRFYSLDEELGKLIFKDGQITFEGNADASAQVFFEHVIKKGNSYISGLQEVNKDQK